MRQGRLLLWLASAGIVAVLTYFALRSHTPPILDASGKELPNSIALLEKINTGGVEQYILIRRRRRENPVLLFPHGGPGMATMFLAHDFQAPLENDFVVVQWDRRGAGKSHSDKILPESMSVEPGAP